MEHTKGDIFVGSTDAIAIIVGKESRDYIAGVQIQQIGGGAIAGAMEERRKANAEHIVKCWNSHDDLLEACKEGQKRIRFLLKKIIEAKLVILERIEIDKTVSCMACIDEAKAKAESKD